MEKRQNVVTFAGNPVTLLGSEVKVGQTAPAFTVVANDLSAATLADFASNQRCSFP